MGRAVNTHLVAWSEPRTQANQSSVTEVFRNTITETEILGVRPHWGNGETEQEDSNVTKAHLFTYFLQKFALHSQFPGGHLLCLLALRLAGGVRVGNVDPELAFLLSHRDEQTDISEIPVKTVSQMKISHEKLESDAFGK